MRFLGKRSASSAYLHITEILQTFRQAAPYESTVSLRGQNSLKVPPRLVKLINILVIIQATTKI